jgi:hypothetical protein
MWGRAMPMYSSLSYESSARHRLSGTRRGFQVRNIASVIDNFKTAALPGAPWCRKLRSWGTRAPNARAVSTAALHETSLSRREYDAQGVGTPAEGGPGRGTHAPIPKDGALATPKSTW